MSFGNRPDLDFAIPEQEREQPLADAEQPAQVVRDVPFGTLM